MPNAIKKILIAQTAFIGDVILATPIIEELSMRYPDADIDFLLRKGNDSLLKAHPKLRRLLIWDKKEGKYRSMARVIRSIRSERYDLMVNCQRFLSSGIISAFSKARIRIGFSKNPLSGFYTYSIPHHISEEGGQHEVERNLRLLSPLGGSGHSDKMSRPKLYPSRSDFEAVQDYTEKPFLCIAPASVWFTKQYPVHKWVELLDHLPSHWQVYLVGGPGDSALCEAIMKASSHRKVMILAGELSLLKTAALFSQAAWVYSNDSAPLHLASAMNTPTKAVFCSTIPAFGFGPLANHSEVIEVAEQLDCRPCGLHGKKECPKGHFYCAEKIKVSQLLEGL